MTSSYGSRDRVKKQQTFDGFPESLILSTTEENVIFDVYREEDFKDMYEILEEIIEEGQTYPQDSTEEQTFRLYFLSDNCFVFRLSTDNRVIGGFNIKPYFPGRCVHIANCALAVRMEYRGKGLGKLMAERIVKLTKAIGYEALFTNVFATNPGSIPVCKKYGGFVEVGRLPRAGNLKQFGLTDSLQLYRDLRTE